MLADRQQLMPQTTATGLVNSMHGRQHTVHQWYAALPGLGTGYPVAITRVPGPGYKLHLT